MTDHIGQRRGSSVTPRVENREYGAFVRRVVAAYARRVGQGDVEALPDLIGLAAEVNVRTSEAVAALHRFGYSWAEIAARIGTTRASVHERWATPRDTTGTHHGDQADQGDQGDQGGDVDQDGQDGQPGLFPTQRGDQQ